MRPVRLELEGFTAFRDRTVVDLAGADLFALCGPTGAGKSSVIDAITFALYGSVPRLDMGIVAPVIAQNALEARVRLDFTAGERGFVAVRVVRATKSGATTKEARLETADGEVLAADARTMTAAVTDLLGLDFKQFTTCISLPQGEFARFLHTEPRHRQDLLVRLLDLGLYDRVAQTARQRERLAAERAAVADGQLANLSFATAPALAAAEHRVDELTTLRHEVTEALPRLDELQTRAGAADRAAEEAEAAVELLTVVRIPAVVDRIADDLLAATTARDEAIDAEVSAEEALAKAEATLAGLPARAELERHEHDHAEAARLRALEGKGVTAVADAQRELNAATDALASARELLDRAEQAVHDARTAHLAHALAAEVVVGEPCPVCRSVVTEPPVPAPGDVATAERARAEAARCHEDATRRAAAAGTEQARVQEKLAGVREQLATLAARLADAPAPDDVGASLKELAAAEAALDATRTAAGRARRARADAATRLDIATKVEHDARRAFDAVRDRVAPLGPPAAERADLLADWRSLLAWADERRPVLAAQAKEQRAAADASRAALARDLERVEARCRALAVDPGEQLRDAVVDALATADNERRRIVEALEQSTELRAAADAARTDAAVAGAVANHLRADGFERWLLDEALRELVAGATTILLDLSGGAYSLALDDKSRAFAVVDHVNADSVRPARTLSGGETFLASLALALALADQVAASAAAARLETILLDEGFGTLDADTLEIVAAALEELGARGRMVGVVTHVRELAERLPVRFELTKVGGASTIERIDP